ncbi:MAG: SAM hydrolase/SAM-dependent halogenase family protein [Sciscionella sp.]
MRYDWVSFTTDYGLSDGFVATCHGVIARIAPTARVIDVTHEVSPQDIRRGALVLAQTVRYLPPAVHLGVVDPGVGSARRGVVIEVAESVLVGPDNGLLLPAAEALGGVVAAYQLTAPEFRLPEVAATFHGRDIFAPAAAHLTLGVPPEAFGGAITDLVRLPDPVNETTEEGLRTEVIDVDHFGNVALAASARELGMDHGTQVVLHIAGADLTVPFLRTFTDAPPGEPLLLTDSAGHLALALNGGSAAAHYHIAPGTPLLLTREHL